jgi:hypothetical protein
MSCNQAVCACYDVTLLAAQTMLTDGEILRTYLEARIKETELISASGGIAAVLLLGNAAMACQAVAASLSFSALGAFFTARAWPTVLTITNPAGLAVSVIGLTILGISIFVKSGRKQDILHQQNYEH